MSQRRPESAAALRPRDIRLLAPADLEAIVGLQQLARANLPDPTLLADDPPEFFARHLVAPNLIGGIERQGRLVAFGVLGFAVPPPQNFGAHLGFAAPRLATVGQLDGAVVDPEFRSAGLHARLVRWRIRQAMARHCTDVLSTAAPRNLASWRNMVRHGMHAVALRFLFGGLPRLVLHRDLVHPRVPDGAATYVCPLDEEALAAEFARGRIGIAVAGRGMLMAPLAKES
jgi:GNAT superfamily N-acetyltransferase